MRYNFLDGLLNSLKPTPLMTVSEWSDKNRYLTSESAAEPGKWKTSRTPYLREIIDNMSPNNPINEIVFIKGVQLGATEGALNSVGCFIDIAPCPIMYVMPTLEMSKAISESRVDPMIENSPALREKVRPNRERDAGNTKFVKKFPGGVLVLSGANSAASLRSRPVKVLVLDECDAYPVNVDDEGSPISLAEKRTSTFGAKRKVYKLSTPTIEGQSVIESEYLTSEQRKYFVPCPHCNHKQHLVFDNLKWEKGRPETAMYYCEECGAGIEERFKSWFMAEENGAEWIATVSLNQKPLRRGYHLNSLYSPIGWLSWADIAQQFEDATNDVNKLRVFVNTILGETWKEKGEAPPWENIFNRREEYRMNVPKKDVVFLTAGADVQNDRIEFEIVGWCRGKRTYSVDYRVILGDTSGPKVWDELSKVLGETWEREDGATLPLRLMAIDSGYNTHHVYAFSRRFDVTRVIPIKGQDRQQTMVAPPKAVDVSTSGKKMGKVKVWNVGVSLIKSEIYGYLKLEKDENGVPPDGYCHFPQYNHEYFRGITAEQLQFRVDRRGFKTYEWIKKYPRNEPLDCRVYARAAAAVLGIDRFKDEHWDQLEKDNAPKPQEKPKPKKRTSFW